MKILERVHSEWRDVLQPFEDRIAEIEEQLEGTDFLPSLPNIFRALEQPKSKASVLIVGQDPYPSRDFACGWAFSTPPECRKIPASLRNIKEELLSDIGHTQVAGGDLSPWVAQGVVLLNRSLSVTEGQSDSHKNLGWQEITDHIASVLGQDGCVAILWGKSAQELSKYFPSDRLITGVHPSPLSAYRGFFGSKPFSRVNSILRSLDKPEIIW